MGLFEGGRSLEVVFKVSKDHTIPSCDQITTLSFCSSTVPGAVKQLVLVCVTQNREHVIVYLTPEPKSTLKFLV